jgi:hypothetical protein
MDIIVILFIPATLVFIITSAIINTRRAKRKLRERLIQSWGKPSEEKYEPGDLESVASYFMNQRKANAGRFFIKTHQRWLIDFLLCSILFEIESGACDKKRIPAPSLLASATLLPFLKQVFATPKRAHCCRSACPYDK